MSLIPLKRNKQEWDHDNHPYSFDNPNIYMRPATEDDVDNMYSWEMESIDKSLQEDPKVQQLIRDDCYQSIKDTQMIMDQDKTIGMFTACIIDNGEWRYIGEIYLIPEYRGQHIGSTILKNEIANYDRIRLQVAYDNENALRLYKSLGFKIVKENKEGKLYIMEYDKSLPVTEAFFKEAYLKAKEKEKLKDSAYGIPELRKYPLTNKNGDYDENHIRMAVKFFGSAPKKYKKELAKRILRAAHSIDLDTEKWDTINKALKNHKESVVQEGFFEVGFGNLRKTIADKLGKFVTVTNVQNPTGKEAKFVIKSNEHPEDYVNVIAMGNGVKAYGYKDSERVSIFNNASLSAAMQKLIDSVCDLFDIQKPINESYTERKNFIMKEQITKILDAYNSGVLTQEEASTKIEAIREQVVTESAVNTTDDLRVKQEKIMESFKMGIINATEGMRLIERVMMEADYITEEEDSDDVSDNTLDDAAPADDEADVDDAVPEDADTSESTQIGALAEYINSLDDAEREALLAQINTSAPEGEEPVTEEDASDVAPADVAGSDVGEAGADVSIDDMEV